MGTERWDLFISSRRKGITPPLRGRRDERRRSLTTYQSAAPSKSAGESSGRLIRCLGLPPYSFVVPDASLVLPLWFCLSGSDSLILTLVLTHFLGWTVFSSALQTALNYQLHLKIN